MGNKVSTSAPGKLTLLGEHAVLYGYPCIVTAIGQRIFCTAEITNDLGYLQINAPDIEVYGYKKLLTEIGKADTPKEIEYVETSIKYLLKFIDYDFSSLKGKIQNHGIKISIKADFTSKMGLGSSSASTVCTIKAVAELLGIPLSKKELFDIAYETVLHITGSGSGVDIAASVFGGTLYFTNGGKKIESLKMRPIPFLIAYSGKKADTATLVSEVRKRTKRYPDVYQGIYKQIGVLVEYGKKACISGDHAALGELMNINQGYLEALGVSTAKLSRMIFSARDAGAFGAKISGAGGGDCIIALTADAIHKEVRNSIIAAGGKHIDTATNVEGVRSENL